MTSSLRGTRLKILDIIQRQGSATVHQIAEETGLSAVTIRRHLEILRGDHFVSFEEVHHKVGRPEFVYKLTEEGHESGYREYQKLLTLLLNEVVNLSPTDLADKDGEKLLGFLIERLSDQISRPYVVADQSSKEAHLEKLEEALSAGGFSPEITQEGNQVCVLLHNCPFRAAALGQKLLCHFDQHIVANILGVEPTEQYTIHDGSNACCYVAKVD